MGAHLVLLEAAVLNQTECLANRIQNGKMLDRHGAGEVAEDKCLHARHAASFP